MNELKYKNFNSVEDLVKWINQYHNLINVFTITYGLNEYIVFYYWIKNDRTQQ